MTCPHCGSALKVDADRQKAFCQYCGTELLIDDEVKMKKWTPRVTVNTRFSVNNKTILTF